jgi:hypothetical protein
MSDPGADTEVDQHFAALQADLEQLDADYVNGFAHCQRHVFVTTPHSAT